MRFQLFQDFRGDVIPQFKGRQLFLPKNELPIMSFSRMAFFASMVAMVASIVLWSSMGLNFGVDFKGGSMIEVRAKAERANIADLRAKTGGLGLGLALVKGIVLAHGGTIAVDEGELGGARFTIRLPRRPAPTDEEHDHDR